MHIETQRKKIRQGAEEVYRFLTELENFRLLMPDNLEKFELISPDQLVFTLKGMPEIALKRKSQHPFKSLVLGSASDRMPFTLTADIAELDATHTEVALSFEGAFNTMMAMMVKGPITNFMNTLSENLVKIEDPGP